MIVKTTRASFPALFQPIRLLLLHQPEAVGERVRGLEPGSPGPRLWRLSAAGARTGELLHPRDLGSPGSRVNTAAGRRDNAWSGNVWI